METGINAVIDTDIQVHTKAQHDLHVTVYETRHPFIDPYTRWIPGYLVNQIFDNFVLPAHSNGGLLGFMETNPEIRCIEVRHNGALLTQLLRTPEMVSMQKRQYAVRQLKIAEWQASHT